MGYAPLPQARGHVARNSCVGGHLRSWSLFDGCLMAGGVGSTIVRGARRYLRDD